MRKILFVGKMNETMKDLNLYLSKCFHVQLCAPNAEALSGVLSVMKPEIVLVSLIGLNDVSPDIFFRLQNDYPHLPAITIGTENERAKFAKYLPESQFQHLLRPLENSMVQDAIVNRLGMSREELESAALMSDADERKLILVVDDNAATLRAIKGILEERYRVIMAPSGIKAMTLIGKKRPDLILLDYEMPVVDGRQTLEMIRAEESLQDIPVIFLTSLNDREHIEAVLKLRPSGYLLKPPVKELLFGTIEKALLKN